MGVSKFSPGSQRGVDATPTANSKNLVESGGVKSALTHDLANIVATGSTNTTGAIISSGTYFYLDGALVQAKENIDIGAPFTLNTNYKVVTAGGLNELKSALDSTLKCYAGKMANVELNAGTDTNVYLTDLPANWVSIVGIVPLAEWPNTTWNTYVYAKRPSVPNRTIGYRTTGSTTQTYTIEYLIFYI